VDGALTVVVAIAAALALTPLAARVATRVGVLDHPGALKVHDTPVPYLGGTAVFGALALGALVGGLPAKWLLPLALALALGIADDVASVSPKMRLFGEAVIGVVAGLVVDTDGGFGIVVAAVAVVALINAVNLLDGLDGLAAGVVLASAVGFAIIGGPGRPLALALAGALAGFLVFNRPPARIYLGDGGSYLLGATLGVLAASALYDKAEPVLWIVVPLLVAVPLADTAIAILRRAKARRPIFTGDRSHVYDQLVDHGRTRGEAVLLCVGAQATLVVTAVLMFGAVTQGGGA
jgi:UDP-GlcNAc:undecaprenyl-phosphate GlcNAc-1-phosphate transferase